MGHVAQRSKWDCKGYLTQSRALVQGVKNGFVQWGYGGQRREVTEGIRVEDVRWLMRYLGPLTDRQLRAALVACGAAPAEVECYTEAIRTRISRLREL